MSLGLKLLVIYLLVSGGFVLAAVQGVSGLHQMSTRVRGLVETDLQQVVALNEIKSALTHLHRSMQQVPASPQNVRLLRQSRRDLERALRVLERTSPDLTRELTPLYQDYLQSVQKPQGASPTSAFQQIPYGRLADRVEDLVYESQESLRKNRAQLGSTTSSGISGLFLTYLGFFSAGLLAFAWFSLRMQAGIRQLRGGMDAVSQGNYDVHLPALGKDELGLVLRDFNQMSSHLKSTRQLFLDASPLTYLPGNIAIERALSERLKKNEIFALCYIDLDDFKPYNDHYGYARGSEVIKATADVIHQVQRDRGSDRDFVGHIGGDDFVLVTSMDLVEPICGGIIEAFDQMIPGYYSEDDRAQGFIASKDRFGQEREFPLMTISLAVVTNANRDVRNPIEIAKIAAEIKEYVKLMPGSNYMVDRRTHSR